MTDAHAPGAASVRACKRCLLSELAEDAYFKSVYEYIASLPAEDKAEDGLYQSRLAACKACDCLQNGMCRLCGCFVEVRAVKKRQGCPGAPAKW